MLIRQFSFKCTFSNFQAFSALADAAYDNAQCSDDDNEPTTYILSEKFSEIIQKIIATGDRSVQTQKLRITQQL